MWNPYKMDIQNHLKTFQKSKINLYVNNNKMVKSSEY